MSKLMYLRPSRDEQPVGCVAFSTEGDTLSYQFSVLNPADKFDRTLGRKIATGRLEKTPIVVEMPGAGSMSYRDAIVAVMACVVATPGTPGRAIKAAKRWLAKNTH